MERTQVDNIVALAADLAGKADKIDEVIVIYTVKHEREPHVLDNGLDVATGVYLCQLFINWILACINNPK